MTAICCTHPGCKNEAKTLALFVASDRKSSEVGFCKEHTFHLGMDYLLLNPMSLTLQILGHRYEECVLYAIVFSHDTQQYHIVLRGKNGQSTFVCETGYVQACSLYGAVKAANGAVPLTYELFANIITSLGGSIVEAIVDGFDKQSQTYEFHLILATNRGSVKVKCRGSDAIGIAYFANRPIKVDAAFLGRDSLSRTE